MFSALNILSLAMGKLKDEEESSCEKNRNSNWAFAVDEIRQD